ncbi:replicative DNA helicase [Brevibacillus migulae]|uniref:replicative DNA helicase n=1 Tax=Brevibacillus migulae TaxID=1644114 RepID=UPI00142FAE96|nr:replicative DNA helicase [Brevibacillus migulae]
MIYNEQAEQTVIGCILLKPELIKDCRLQQEQMTETNGLILWAMRQLEKQDKPADMVHVTSILQDHRKLERVGGAVALTKLASSVPTVHNFQYYEQLVLEAWQAREAFEASRWLQEALLSGERTQAVNAAIQRMMKLQDSGKAALVDKRRIMLEMWEEYESTALKGISTGYRPLDAMTGGFKQRGGDFWVVAARPSVGKTAFALCIGFAAATNGAIVVFFSLEMSEKMLIKRLQSAVGMINSLKLRDPQKFFDEKDWEKLAHAVGIINTTSFEIVDEPVITAHDVRSILRKLRSDNPDRAIIGIIDYLQLMKPHTKEDNRTNEVAAISRELKQISRELEATIVALGQLNRGVEGRANKRPAMSDIRDSGAIEQDADLIALLYRDDYYDRETENQNVIEVIIDKQREGPTGTVELAFLKEYSKFVPLSYFDREDTDK